MKKVDKLIIYSSFKELGLSVVLRATNITDTIIMVEEDKVEIERMGGA